MYLTGQSVLPMQFSARLTKHNVAQLPALLLYQTPVNFALSDPDILSKNLFAMQILGTNCSGQDSQAAAGKVKRKRKKKNMSTGDIASAVFYQFFGHASSQ